ncbi:MAG: NADH-quinone oxidoreductase subunit N [Candidatus Sumerlaeaceae bacterium]
MISGNPTPMSLATSVAETLRGLNALVPHLILVVGIILVLVVDWFQSAAKSHRVSWIALLACLASATALTKFWPKVLAEPIVLGWNALVLDPFSLFFALLFLIATFVVVTTSRTSTELAGRRVGEYYALLLTATLAASFLVASRNLVLFYLSFETLSLSSYVLAGYAKNRRESVESSLKYVLFGAVASGVMLYGLSLLYGMVGSLDLEDVAKIAVQPSPSFLLVMVLLLAGFAFKMGLVPFHFWAPDVYQGSPTPVTAYLSVVSKAAGFGFFLRFAAPLLGVPLFSHGENALPKLMHFALLSLLWIVAILTMTLGNLVALRQCDIKRLLAYSSIAHAGYMIAAVVAHNTEAYEAILFYFIVYAIANLGLFFAAQVIHADRGTFDVGGFRGLVHESPVLAASIAMLLWSLIGLPPSGGFMGKFFLFMALVKRGMTSPIASFYYVLILIALANSVISLYYYIGIIRLMAFYTPSADLAPCKPSKAARIALATAALLILAIQLYWQPLTDLAQKGVRLGRQALGTPISAHLVTRVRVTESPTGGRL